MSEKQNPDPTSAVDKNGKKIALENGTDTDETSQAVEQVLEDKSKAGLTKAYRGLRPKFKTLLRTETDEYRFPEDFDEALMKSYFFIDDCKLVQLGLNSFTHGEMVFLSKIPNLRLNVKNIERPFDFSKTPLAQVFTWRPVKEKLKFY